METGGHLRFEIVARVLDNLWQEMFYVQTGGHCVSAIIYSKSSLLSY